MEPGLTSSKQVDHLSSVWEAKEDWGYCFRCNQTRLTSLPKSRLAAQAQYSGHQSWGLSSEATASGSKLRTMLESVEFTRTDTKRDKVWSLLQGSEPQARLLKLKYLCYDALVRIMWHYDASKVVNVGKMRVNAGTWTPWLVATKHPGEISRVTYEEYERSPRLIILVCPSSWCCSQEFSLSIPTISCKIYNAEELATYIWHRNGRRSPIKASMTI